MEWDLLRSFEAVVRLKSLTLASRSLGVSQSTISRHVRRLEEHAKAPLLFREVPVRATQQGMALFNAITPMVDAALEARSVLEQPTELSGSVTISTVGEFLRWNLVQHIPALLTQFPKLRLRILADNQIRSLAAGEADISIRFTRPMRGELVARKLYTIEYGLFAAPTLEICSEIPWLGLAGSLSQIPEQRFIEQLFEPRPALLLLEDFEALGYVTQAGLGVAILPRLFALQLGGLRRVDSELVEQEVHLPTREVWMVVHSAKRQLPRVRAVLDWLIQLSEMDNQFEPDLSTSAFSEREEV